VEPCGRTIALRGASSADKFITVTSLGALPPEHSRVSLAVLVDQRDANLLGNVHGGVIMRIVDSTAGAVAQRHTGGPAVTAAMDEMAFLNPVHIGDIVHAHSKVNWTGRTSLEIGVRVEAEPWNVPGQRIHVASAYLVFVAIDADGGAREIPPLLLTSEDEERRAREAEIRRMHRLAVRAEIEAGRRV